MLVTFINGKVKQWNLNGLCAAGIASMLFNDLIFYAQDVCNFLYIYVGGVCIHYIAFGSFKLFPDVSHFNA